MKPYLVSALPCFALLFASPVLGEVTPPKPAVIGVAVAEVADVRATGTQPSECRLTLSLTGDAVADAYGLHRIRVTKAVDELGRDLIMPADEPVRLADTYALGTAAVEQQRLAVVAAEVARRREVREGAAFPMNQSTAVPTTGAMRSPFSHPIVSVRNPSRQSATIKLLEGEIELFAPTVENGGVLRIPGIPERPAEFVNDAALAQAGIRLMYVTPESYEAKRTAAGVDAGDPAGPWSDEFASFLRTQVKQASILRHPGVYFFVDDPRREVVDLELKTRDGKPLGPPALYAIGRLRAIFLGQPPPPDAQLVVHLATPRALTTYPFKLENIALP